jgi:hypothetical protein
MDPITALGVAGNVLQIVQVAGSIVSKAYRIYKSSDGALVENLDVEAAASGLRGLTWRLDLSLRGETSTCLAENEQLLSEVCWKCMETSNELIGLLEELKIRTTGPRRWASLRKALESIWVKKDILAMAKTFSLYREQLEMLMLENLT